MRALRAIIGWILIIVGGLWTLLTGSCTAYWTYAGVIGSRAADVGMAANGRSLTQYAVMFGAFVIAPGLIVLIIGFLVRPGRQRTAEAKPDQP